MNKRILYLSFYFEPDLCAGSFRNSPLAHELSRQGISKEVEIEVITTLPNRYSTYSVDAREFEKIGNLSIKRIQIPGHKSGVKDQMLSFKVYFAEVMKYISGKHYDLVFASSSRLFTAYLGYRIASRRRLPLYLDIRDIFVDTIKDVFSSGLLRASVLPVMKFIEGRVFNYATHINLISGGFRDYFKRYSRPVYSFYTNGIDPVFINCKKEYPLKDSPVRTVLYAGNIGEGQGLHKVIPQAAAMLGGHVQFRIIGDGGAKKKLLDAVEASGVRNVSVVPPMTREHLIDEYNKADFLFIHLNDFDAFKKVLPSKIFELGVFPKPLIAGVDGFARKFISDNLPDALLLKPCDSSGLFETISSYNRAQIHDRREFIRVFNRESLNRQMAESILSYL